MVIKKILVIDDEDDLRKLIQTYLELIAGWQVSTARSGREGLTKAEIDQPDMILLDLMMPEMNGLTTLQHLRANSSIRHIPVILLTARGRSATINQFSQWDIQGTISKPFKPLNLVDQIVAALDDK
jgi:CheY-like chemotaxis protein